MDELKPCPFCGNEASTHAIQVNQHIKFEVCCDKCFASMDHFYKSQEEAIRDWNRRV